VDIPYWLDEGHEPLPQRSLAGPPDAVVVGGGITGCSCALTLARAGMRVRLHEARAVASGASGRNGGFALRGGAMAYHRAREWLGPERAREYWRWTESHLDRIEAVSGDAFRRLGSLRLAADEELDELREEFEALLEDGFEGEWTDELHPRLEGRFTAAIVHPRDGVLHPARFVRKLAWAAAEAGVEIREHSRVESLEELHAEAVVVATDGYPSGLLGELEGLIVPTRAQMLATEPLPELLYERPHYGRQGFDYWHQRADGSLLVGGFRDISLESEFTDEERTTEPIQGELERFAEDLAGTRPRITHRWAGIFGLVLDFLPVVGRVPGKDSLWVAGGYSGHGNVLGFACGELVAEAILGRPGWQLELFDPARLVLA
jgi:glycine/D-amino acid oxidase-like deaminating enzyme